MSPLQNAKSMILIEMGLAGLADHMRTHAKRTVGMLALAASIGMSQASAADLNRGGVVSGAVGAFAGKVLADTIGINAGLGALSGAMLFGKVGNDAYAKDQAEKERLAQAAARAKLTPDMERKIADLRALAESALSATENRINITDEQEISIALDPVDGATAAKYEASVRAERTNWNAYVAQRERFFNAVNTVESHGFDVDSFKREAEALKGRESPSFEAIRERSRNAYWTPVRTGH